MSRPPTDIAAAIMAAWNADDLSRVITLAEAAPEAVARQETILLLHGLALRGTARHAAAVTVLRRLTTLRPGVSAYWNNLGVTAREGGDFATAEKALTTAQSLAPRDPEVAYNLGLLYLEQRRWQAARDTLLAAVDAAPDFIDARLQAAHACYVCGDNANQEHLLADAATWPPQQAEQALVLAAMLSVEGKLDAALRTLAAAQLPAEPAARAMRLRIAAQRAALYERNNDVAAAAREIQAAPLGAIDALPEREVQARVDGWRAHAVLAARRGEPDLAATLYQRTIDLAPDAEALAGAAFGLAGVRDRQGQTTAAWGALRQAHEAQLRVAREVAPELLAPDSTPLAMADRVVSADEYAKWCPAPATGRSPVFVVGFPRSGTTLLEQMLDAHPDFCSMDERAFIHELTERMELAGQHYPADLATLTADEIAQLRAVYTRLVAAVVPDLGSRRLVDKNPLNMLCLPMIMRLFPDARIILCVRHPCDVLLSCSMQPFRSPAFMVMCSSLERLAQGYARAFTRWYEQVEVFAPHVLEWRYESVIGDVDAELARLGTFLGVEDASAMAGFAEHARRKRFISTPSYAQVTRGLYGQSVQRWEAYREAFLPVLPILQPWIDRFGYST